jgi:hypothetical protein
MNYFSHIYNIFFFLKLIHFLTKNLLVDILPKTNLTTPSVYKRVDGLINCSPKMQGVNNEGLLLTSLYLQKMSKYLHLINTSDLTLNHASNLNTSHLTLYNVFQSELTDVNFMLFFSTSNKYNLKSTNNSTFLNKESLFLKCIDNNKLMNSHSYVLNANILRTLPFTFQKEFNTIVKRNLTLGKENK